MKILSNWFQLSPIPANAIDGYYDITLVVLSYVIAVLASYATLTIVGRLRAEGNTHTKVYWLTGGAFTMGSGIWSMHFIGMLAFVMPMPMGYELGWTFASLIMATLASALVLFILQRNNYSKKLLALGGLIIGLGIAAMHYMGMEGMRGHMSIHYIPTLFFLSIIIGIGAAEAAIYLSLQSNIGSNKRQFYYKSVSALIMGIAICGMHYTGMEAAVFVPNNDMVMVNNQTLQSDYLAFFIAGITALIITLALTASTSKKMITAITNEKDFLNAMLDNLEDGIVACDDKGYITVLNRALQKRIPTPANKKLHYNDLQQLYSVETLDNQPVSDEDKPLNLAMKGIAVHGKELLMRFKNNEVREVVVNCQSIINTEGKNIGGVSVIHDVTELKKTEKLKKEFVSIVSHELRTPLTSIRGSLGLLVSGVMGDFPDKAMKLIQIANNNCERLLLLINDILDIEKMEEGKMDFDLKTIDLNQLVKEAITANKMYAEKFEVMITLDTPDVSSMVHVDSSRLMQVLANLISNACKFSPAGETIAITIKQIGHFVRVAVVDKGPGISEEFHSRIFQKFSQADSSDTRGKGGTGLGLNISKTIIEKLNGILNFQSRANQGTTFYFDLPLINTQIQTNITDALTSITGTKRRLLICEDDNDQSKYLKVLLESAGFTADVTSTVAKAKELLNRFEYDALLLDLILPDQDGIAFIRDLRANDKTKNLHVIVISVIAQTGQSILNGDALSVIDWFDKPIDFNKLLSSINRVKKQSLLEPKILHIEDNKDIQHVVSALLEGHAGVTVANSLNQARDLLDKNNYDLIILDLLLPDGNGMEILPLLSQYRIPVLVFSDMQLNKDYAKFVSQALTKSTSSNETLLSTIMHLL